MGAWGVGHFDNDDAGDWVWELEEAKSLDPVRAAIEAVEASDDYLEAPEASIALAAAETVAATLGKPVTDLPDSVAALISELGKPSPELVTRAKFAVTKIADVSELRELWEETDDFSTWQAKVSDLLERLQ
jgi:hypothetical protein